MPVSKDRKSDIVEFRAPDVEIQATKMERFKKTNDNRWQCVNCNKVMIKQSKYKHSEQACLRQKIGLHVCMHCGKEYEKVNSRQKHELACGKSLVPYQSTGSSNSSGSSSMVININNNSHVENQHVIGNVKNYNENNIDNVHQNNIRNLNQQYVDKLNQNNIGNLNQQYVENLNQQYVENLNQQYVENLNQQFVENLNQNIVLNAFGDEEVAMLCADAKKLEKELQKHVLNNGLDGLAKVIAYTFFNKEFPENRTIRKPLKNDDFVDVHVGNNVWESQTLETAMKNVKKKTEPILELVLAPVFRGDRHLYNEHQDNVNALFTDVLVPLGYGEMVMTWRDYLGKFNPLLPHKIEQERQIAMRKMKKILYDLTKRMDGADGELRREDQQHQQVLL